MPGLIAKASVFEVPPDDDYLDEHHDTLARSVISDLATIGGAA